MGSRALMRRRAAEIHAYVGENGGFKSFCAVRDTIPSLLMGRKVVSTLLFLDPDHQASCEAEAEEAWAAWGIDARPTNPLALPHPLWRPVRTWADIMGLERSDLVLDEVQGIVNSRAHQSLPPAVMNQIHQMRRQDCIIRWTTPAYARADVSLREVTKAVTYCRGFLPAPGGGGCPMNMRTFRWECGQDHDHIPARLWGQNRVAVWRTYNALAFDEFTSADVQRRETKQRPLKALAREAHVRRRSTMVARYYDTMAPVLSIRDVTETGMCLACGGNRRRPACTCAPVPGSEDAPAQRGARRSRHRDAGHQDAAA
jgi:hypothetical protein